jgi:hypothetical protein
VPRNTERTKTTVHTGTALAATETKSMDTTLFQTRLQVLAVPGSYQVPWFGSVNEVEQVFANRNTLVTRGDPINAELISRSDGRQVVVKRLNIASELAHEALYQELSIMYMFVDNDLFVKVCVCVLIILAFLI